MEKSDKTPRWRCHSTMVPSKLHHGAVKTPPWWSGNATTVKFLQHHGVLSDFSMVICQWNRGCAPPKLPRLRCKAKARTSSRAPQNFPTQKVSRFLLRRGENQSTQPNLHNGVKKTATNLPIIGSKALGNDTFPKETECFTWQSIFFPKCLAKSPEIPTFAPTIRKVAQLVAHYVRDVGVGRSSRLFPTRQASV